LNQDDDDVEVVTDEANDEESAEVCTHVNQLRTKQQLTATRSRRKKKK
jgi:hypothetical protein